MIELLIKYGVMLTVLAIVALWFFCWGQSRMRRIHEAEIIAIRIEGLRERSDDLQKILRDSDNGRVLDKVSKRLNDVTNKLLELEG